MINRELKIGLLLALGFVILTGVLISEHITTVTQPPAAFLANAGSAVREAIDSPGTPVRDEPTVEIPAAPAPVHTVATRDQLNRPREPDTMRLMIHNNAMSNSALALNEDARPKPTLNDLVETHTSELAFIDPRNTQPQANRPAIPASGVREYTAQKGDSLAKMARSLLGADTPANRQAIVELNPSLRENPNLIIAGKSYTVPVDPRSAQLISQSADRSAQRIADPPPAPQREEKPVEPKTRVYVVKPGDSLWKIADRECGSASKIDQIKSLNEAVLKGSDVVKVGMKLTLPAGTN